ncbi:MAG: hypothetical protein IJB85_05510 [Clostridia bacterium]|nr:hypothetical protein [Clostridia bacterium]
MEKRTWSTPAAVAEQFMANEYVNACWSVECIIPDSNDPITGSSAWQPDAWGSGYHQGGACGDEENQYIRDIGVDKYEVTEFKQTLFGWTELDADIYQGTFTQDQLSGFNPSNSNNDMWGSSIILTKENEGQYIFWRTEYLNTTYYHYGVVDLIDSNRTAQHSN